MRIATWNVNSLNVRLPHVLDWLETEQPDVLALQETKMVDEKFPAQALQDAGYHSAFTGQKTYNGVALLSREPATDVVTDPSGVDTEQRRIIAGTFGDTRVVDLYVVNGQEVGSDKYVFKLDWLARVTEWLREEAQKHEKLVVVGDFNIAPADEDVHTPEEWVGRILCSEPERDALEEIQSLGLSDVFRQFEQPEKTFSWWDYRAAGFRRNRGLRIDLILASEALANSCQRCVVDKEPRKLERPSDHAPVVADFI